MAEVLGAEGVRAGVVGHPLRGTGEQREIVRFARMGHRERPGHRGAGRGERAEVRRAGVADHLAERVVLLDDHDDVVVPGQGGGVRGGRREGERRGHAHGDNPGEVHRSFLSGDTTDGSQCSSRPVPACPQWRRCALLAGAGAGRLPAPERSRVTD